MTQEEQAKRIIELLGDCSQDNNLHCGQCPLLPSCTYTWEDRVVAARAYLCSRKWETIVDESVAPSHSCTCDIGQLMREGCKCGGT